MSSERNSQVETLKKVMADGDGYTLEALRKRLAMRGFRTSETGVSARVRDLRKAAYGGHTITRSKAAWATHVYVYRMVPTAA